MDTRTKSHQGGRKLMGGTSSSSSDARKKESYGGGIPDMLESNYLVKLTIDSKGCLHGKVMGYPHIFTFILGNQCLISPI